MQSSGFDRRLRHFFRLRIRFSVNSCAARGVGQMLTDGSPNVFTSLRSQVVAGRAAITQESGTAAARMGSTEVNRVITLRRWSIADATLAQPARLDSLPPLT